VSENNADTYAFVGAGVYFSKRCGRTIPFPASEKDGSIGRSVKDPVDAAVGMGQETSTETDPKDAVVGGTVKDPIRRSIQNSTRRHTRDVLVLEAVANDGLSPQLQPRVSKTTCPIADYIVFDGDETQTGSGITGYVHFGDSYASGMGTGVTTGDSCRIGSSNYGDLLFRYLNDSSIAYNGPSSCSGDTIKELINHIQAWSNPADTTLATLTIGGNDVGFMGLVWDCVVTPFINSQNRGAADYRDKCGKHTYFTLPPSQTFNT
jgi:hypothetical protein